VSIDGQQNGYGVYENYRKARVLGVYHWLPELEVALLAEQDEAEAMAPTFNTLTISGVAAVLTALLAGFLALLLARSITEPLANLVKTATQVAEGDLQQVAIVVRHDEIGVLAEAFNRMTDRLRELINNLEAQVKERTASLEWQTLKLETSTKVSREITSILDTDELLNRVAIVIQQAFNYYHVAIYLVDQESNQLIFMAGAGEKSQPWKDSGQNFPINPEHPYGQVVQSNHALLVDHTLQGNPSEMDENRSELVAPLRIRDWVSGILVVQSTEPYAFRKEDIEIIQSLGDQVAIAIENARLYNRVRLLATLEERQRLARELHDYVTQSLYGLVLFSGAGIRTLDANDLESTRQYMQKIARTANHVLKDMRLLLYQLRNTEQEGENLLDMLRHRLDAVEDRLGIETHLDLEGELTLPPPVENCLCGIVQEALNNALRHSDAKRVCIHICAEENWVKLVVTDDGIGFDMDKASQQGGMGFLGMRERVQKIGGHLSIESAPGKGTRVSVIIPQGNFPVGERELPEVFE
jgi:two-component system nitrate/nitrite sensor histidine kinase NarX